MKELSAVELYSEIDKMNTIIKVSKPDSMIHQQASETKIKLLEQQRKLINKAAKNLKTELDEADNSFEQNIKVDERVKIIDKLTNHVSNMLDEEITKLEDQQSKFEEDSVEYIEYGELITEALIQKSDNIKRSTDIVMNMDLT